MEQTLLTPPSHEPVTLKEVKEYLKISTDLEDKILNTFITASRRYVEGVTGLALLKQQWGLKITPPYPKGSPLVRHEEGDLFLTLPWPPLIEINKVLVGGKDVPYFLHNKKVKLSPHLWEKEISIFYWAGYGEDPSALPSDLKLAVLFATRFFYEDKKPDLPLLRPYRNHRFH